MKILKKNKKMIMGVCALAFSVSLAAGFGVVSTGVSADNVTLQTQANTFTITEGAAVRLAEPYGIRYTATISKANFDTIASAYASVEYGVLICPTDLLTGKTLDFDESDGLVPGEAGEGEVEFGFVDATPVLDETTGLYTIKGSLVGIKEANLSRPFTGKAYIKATDAEGNINYAYTGEESRAIYTVATYAVNDPDEEVQEKLDSVVDDAEETPREYLNSIIDKVQTVYGNPEITVTSSNPETAQHNILNGGDTVTVSAKVSKTVDGVTRTLDACPTLSVDGDSGITLEQISATEYTVKGSNKTGYNLNATIGTGEHKLSAVAFEENVTSWQEQITPDVLGAPYDGGKPATLTMVEDEESEFFGAYHWTDSKYIGVQPIMTNTFNVGDRVVFDIYATDGMLVMLSWAGVNDVDIWNRNSSKQYGTITDGNGDPVFSFRTLETATGKQITQGPGNYKKQWLTFEVTILKEAENAKFNVIYYEISGSYALANGVYIRNFEVLKYSTETTVTLADGVTIDEAKVYDFLTPINIGNVEVTDARGVSEILPASATGGYIKDGILYTGLGEQKIVINAEGFDGGLEYTIQGPTSAAILDGEKTLSNLVLGANAKLTYEEAYARNSNAWLASNNGKEDAYSDAAYNGWNEMSDGFTFTDAVASAMKANTYLYMEVYAPTGFALSCYNNGIRLLYNEQANNTWAYYAADGTALTGTECPLANAAVYVKQWLTIEMKITSDWNTKTDSISCLAQFDGNFRFGKITLSTTKIENPTIQLEETISIVDKAYFTQGDSITFEKSKDEGFTDAYYYAVTDDTAGNEKRAFGYFTDKAKAELLKDGMYLYITIYKPESFLFCFMGCGDAHFLYSAGAGSSATSGVSWTQYSYDAEGNPKKTTTGNVTKEWVTYEIKFSATSVANANSQIYFFKYLTAGEFIYVKDFTYSTTQLTAFANAQ